MSHTNEPTHTTTRPIRVAPFLTLPDELIQHILSFLSPRTLARVSQTCRRLYTHTLDEQLWHPFVQPNTPGIKLPLFSPAPQTYREIYATLHPYWFLTRHKVWFSDRLPMGSILIARYDPRFGSIRAHNLVASKGPATMEFWAGQSNAIIHSFHPKVQLDLNRTVIKLDKTMLPVGDGPLYSQEVWMDVHADAGSKGLTSMLALAHTLPPARLAPTTSVWPPWIIPASARTGNQSHNHFRSTGHRPQTRSDVSQTSFRLRKFLKFTNRIVSFDLGDFGTHVDTYTTLDPKLYTPTRQKPWRGIWVGDYSGHGCEFLAVMQPEESTAGPIPTRASQVLEARRSNSVSSDGSYQSAQTILSSGESAEIKVEQVKKDTNSSEDEVQYTGRIEAVKLTGDANVPRGEYTFIAPDIGPGGLVRVATEGIFEGARIVRSVGHIAEHGFNDDKYIPSQLILISKDLMAQYWEEFGHVSMYRRVEIDSFLDVE
ncbi:hypothetical protein M501DRAFT_938699 [Patellaria atrata CBS 101060]|uniref:F-box domain-containing protein n=1 Tax=Patellaria atrata CBS 101060 TaxID=1346257 RepID=A0A9P4VPT6_9PEZI|nr:hypothetical protein M501DRAFT_938699 [Patellaria atrata CBS 101060]